MKQKIKHCRGDFLYPHFDGWQVFLVAPGFRVSSLFFQGMGPLGAFNIHGYVKRIGIMAETLSKRYRGSRVGGA